MAQIFDCPACGGKFRLASSASVSSRIRCPHCSQTLVVTGLASLAVEAGQPLAGDADNLFHAASSSALAGPIGPRYRRTSRTRLYVIVGICGAAVYVVVVAILLVGWGQRKVDTLSSEPNAVATQILSTAENALATPVGRESAAVPPPSPSSDGVDLLGLIDPSRDAIGATWTRQGGSLACSGGSRWSLVVPRPPPAGYRWTIVAERLSGSGSLNLFLVVDGRGVMAVLEGYGNQQSGLSTIGGRSADRNETTRRRAVFHAGKPTTIVCTVTRSMVEIVCDGKPLIAWKGAAQRLSYEREIWPELSGDRLAVSSFQGDACRIDRMELVEIDPGEAITHDAMPATTAPHFAVPPWARREPPLSRPTEPPAEKSPPPRAASRDLATVPTEQLPEPVRRSKESVCIIEHPLGSGSGFVVGENLVATNAHVVEGVYVTEIECQFSVEGTRRFRAKRVLYEDNLRDLCLLEIETERAPIPLVSGHVLSPGEKVIIVGNPALGRSGVVLRDAVTEGTIQTMVHAVNCDFYQIDGDVDSGSSGGPALNEEGAVVAVIAMKATEQGEGEIRQALSELDSTFSGRLGSTEGRGIAFGIPVNDLNQAIEEVRRQSESAAARVGDRHTAHALLGRMALAGGVQLIRLQMNVPLGVRQQAAAVERKIRSGTIPPATLNQMTRVRIIPEATARALSRELASLEIQRLIRETDMEKYVRHLGASEHLDPPVARGIEALHRSVLETKRLADDPPTNYQAFAQAVKRQSESLKEQILRLEEQLDVGKAAYED